MLVDTSSVRLVISPVPIINVTIYMNKSSLTMSSIFAPLSTILSTIIPCLFAKTIAETSLPLASVDGSCFKGISRALFSLLIWIVSIFSDCLTGLLLREILAAS